MRLREPLIVVLVLLGSAAVIFAFFQRQLLGGALGLGPGREVLTHLQASLDDQKRLAELDPEAGPAYRERFAELETTVRRLQILEHNRDRLARRYELILLGIFALSFVAVTGFWATRQARQAPRLARLQEALTALAGGRTDISLGDRGSDTIGRIAAMIERTSRRMARDRRRLAALQNLGAWQEAARRHAHEMRTPLTAARLELDRASALIDPAAGEGGARLEGALASTREELGRLAEVTRHFTRFGRLPRPVLGRHDLAEMLREFVTTFQSAWPNLTLRLAAAESAEVEADRDMLREVLVNLCDNSSQALGSKAGTVTLAVRRSAEGAELDVRDDGPGIAPAIRARIFDPYATTRGIGEGMGLGLAICRKILLDHGGELELLESADGAAFRLTLPRPGSAEA